MNRFIDKDYTNDELVDLGKQKLYNKEYSIGLSLLNEAYKNGSGKAAYELYICYRNGIGTEINIMNSLFFEEEAAKLGYYKAQENLAKRMLLSNDKTMKILGKSWLKKARENNSVFAMLLYVVTNYKDNNIEVKHYLNKLIELKYNVGYFIDSSNKEECIELLNKYNICDYINIDEL